MLSHKSYKSVAMANHMVDAISFLKPKQIPFIISYCQMEDKNFIDDQIKKHFTYNFNRKERIPGYPTQMPHDSKINRDYVSGNQLASIFRSLYNRKESIPTGEISFSLSEKPGIIALTLASLTNMEVVVSPIAYSVPVPSFMFCSSFDDRRFKETFLFEGTAKLENISNNINSDDDNLCFIQCEDIDLLKFMELVKRKLIIKNKPPYEEPGMFRDCPITSIIRHGSKLSFVSGKRLFNYNDHYNESLRFQNELNQNVNKSPRKPFSDFSNFKIWGEGKHPGCLAVTLVNIILCKISERYFVNDPIETEYPFIGFSTSSPYPIKKEGAKISGRYHLYVQLQRLKELDRDAIRSTFDKGIIRAVKIKKAGKFYIENNMIFDPESSWLEYCLQLKNHLNNILIINGISPDYHLYVVQKNQLEGFQENIVAINNYFEIKTGNILSKAFCIIHEKEDTPKTMKYYEYVRKYSKDHITLDHGYPQIFELVLIRGDIIKGVSTEGDEDEFKNRLYFIDNM
jgi:hypothetical protein